MIFSERNPEKKSGAFERLVLRVRDGHVSSVRGDAWRLLANAARNEGNLSFQILSRRFSPFPSITLFADPVSYVGRAVEKRGASCFTSPKEANNLYID